MYVITEKHFPHWVTLMKLDDWTKNEKIQIHLFINFSYLDFLAFRTNPNNTLDDWLYIGWTILKRNVFLNCGNGINHLHWEKFILTVNWPVLIAITF